jgi:hypothetical protein
MWSITGWETYFPQRCKSHELCVTNTGFAAALSESVVPLALCQNSGGGNVAVGVGFDLTTAYSGVFAYSAGSGARQHDGISATDRFGTALRQRDRTCG